MNDITPQPGADSNNNNLDSSSKDDGPCLLSAAAKESKRKGSGWFSRDQVLVLTRAFAEHRSRCPPETRRALAAQTGLPFSSVTRWFQRQRRKVRATGETLLKHAFASGERAPDEGRTRRLAMAVGWEEAEVARWFGRRRERAIDESIAAALSGLFGETGGGAAVGQAEEESREKRAQNKTTRQLPQLQYQELKAVARKYVPVLVRRCLDEIYSSSSAAAAAAPPKRSDSLTLSCVSFLTILSNIVVFPLYQFFFSHWLHVARFQSFAPVLYTFFADVY